MIAVFGHILTATTMQVKQEKIERLKKTKEQVGRIPPA
jgi:hypothetical protein